MLTTRIYCTFAYLKSLSLPWHDTWWLDWFLSCPFVWYWEISREDYRSMVEQKGPRQGVPLNSEHGDANRIQLGRNLLPLLPLARSSNQTSQLRPEIEPRPLRMWLLDALNLTLIMFGSEFDMIGSIGEFVLICFETLALNILTLKRDRLPRRLVTFRLKIVGKLHNGWWLCDVLCSALSEAVGDDLLRATRSHLERAWQRYATCNIILTLWLLLASSPPFSKSSFLQIETSFNIPTVDNSGVWRFLFIQNCT